MTTAIPIKLSSSFTNFKLLSTKALLADPMPILLKAAKWSQSKSHVHLSIHLRVHNSANVNIFSHANFIKINCAPHYFEAFLSHDILPGASKCKILENEIKFTFEKCVPAMWDCFEQPMAKSQVLHSKNEIIASAQVSAAAETEKRIADACTVKRKEISKEVERETCIRKQIDAIYEDEFKKAMRAVESERTQAIAPVVKKSSSIGGNEQPIRTRGNISIEFSERKFPTPQRESQEHAESEWLRQQHLARKSIGFVEEDLLPEERNPEWLKEKGDSFFAKGNYLAAISAYSTAIRMTGKCYEMFLNRSAAHWAIDNFQRCVEDCSQAYELLRPAVPSNLGARSQCLARRGAALCKLGMLTQGYEEMQAALRLTPDNRQLNEDIVMVQQRLADL